MDILLQTRRLVLRPLEPADAGALFRYRSRADVSRYQVWWPVDEAEVRAFIEKQKRTAPGTPGSWISLAITLREQGTMVGDVGLHFPENSSSQMELGITLSPGFQHRGLAAEALAEVCRYVFFTLGRERVYASVDPRNKPSIRLLERVGMRKELFMPASMVIRGEVVDDLIYGMQKTVFPDPGRGKP